MTGIVLAGGQSRRMGTEKALLRLNGETFLERAVSRLCAVCSDVIIAKRPDQALPAIAGCRTVTDERPGLGPLAGLVAALAASDDEWHLALACDLPLVRPELLRLIAGEAAGADAVVPRAASKLQPLIAAYSRTCLEPARRALSSRRRAVASLLDQVNVKVLNEPQLRRADPDLRSFLNVNTWQDYRAVCKLAADAAPRA